MSEEKRPIGEITVHDKRGYGYIPKIVRKEVGLKGIGKISYYLDANCVLLVRHGATKEEIMDGLDVLKRDIDLRWREKEASEK